MSDSRPLLSARDVAQRLACSMWTVRDLVKRGLLTPVRWGRHRKFREQELERFISMSEGPASRVRVVKRQRRARSTIPAGETASPDAVGTDRARG